MSGSLWPVEPIPPEDLLYCYVHQTWRRKNGGISPSAFMGRRSAAGQHVQSTDWSRYSTPQETRDRARTPQENGVYEVLVGELRAIPGEQVLHSPIQNHPQIPDNRAHADVIGNDHEDPEIKLLFSRIYRVVIPIP